MIIFRRHWKEILIQQEKLYLFTQLIKNILRHFLKFNEDKNNYFSLHFEILQIITISAMLTN